MKVEVLSPVHIGTGEDILIGCYQQKDSKSFYRYDMIDLLNNRNIYNYCRDLNENDINNKIINYLNEEIGNTVISDKNLKSQYEITGCLYGKNENKKKYKKILEQCKNGNVPYIPGSSIKGALFNGWIYGFLQKNKDMFFKYLNEKYENDKNYNFGNEIENSEFLKAIRSCFICKDIYFKCNVSICNEIKNFKENQKKISSMGANKLECIPIKEKVRDRKIFEINKSKLSELLKNENIKNDKHNYKLDLIKDFNLDNIIKFNNDFTKQILEEDLEYFKNIRKYLWIVKQVKDLDNLLKTESYECKSCLIRIGRSTNILSKTILLLIKKNDKELYDKIYNQNIKKVINEEKTDKNNLPNSRSIYQNVNDLKYYLPGFIKIDYYDNES